MATQFMIGCCGLLSCSVKLSYGNISLFLECEPIITSETKEQITAHTVAAYLSFQISRLNSNRISMATRNSENSCRATDGCCASVLHVHITKNKLYLHLTIAALTFVPLLHFLSNSRLHFVHVHLISHYLNHSNIKRTNIFSVHSSTKFNWFYFLLL
jgi:hypothetical protein